MKEAGDGKQKLVANPASGICLLFNGNHHHGFTWDTSGVAPGTTFDFGLIWHWWGMVGTEYGCRIQQVNDSTCILGFEDRGTPPMYVDLILQVVVHKKASIPDLNFPRYSQGDSLWSDSTYDDDVIKKKNGQDSTDANGDTLYYTIRNKGCALCEMAWVLSAYGYVINPLQLNDWMNDPNSLDSYCGPKVNWNAIGALSHGSLNVAERWLPPSQFGNLDYASDVSVLDNYLNNGDLVIAEVNNGGDTHWVVVEPKTNGEYPIVDAGYGDRTTMEVYDNNIWEYVVISRSNRK